MFATQRTPLSDEEYIKEAPIIFEFLKTNDKLFKKSGFYAFGRKHNERRNLENG